MTQSMVLSGPGLDSIAFGSGGPGRQNVRVRRPGDVPGMTRRTDRQARRAPRVGYDAGRHKREYLDWLPKPAGPNLLAEETLSLTRRRVADLIDNNPLISGARELIANNVVGDGIRAIPNTDWDDLDDKLGELFESWAEAVDLERCTTLGESQRQCFNEIWSAGDCLVHYPVADAFNGRARGPAIDLIEAARLDFDWSQEPTKTTGRIRQGVEFDALGRRVAYHVLQDDPNDVGLMTTGLGSREHLRIPSTQAMLGLFPRKLKLIRGVPWAVSSVGATRLEDGFWEATILLARAAACVGLYLKNSAKFSDAPIMEGGEDEDYTDTLVDSDGEPVTALRAGLVGYVPEGVEPALLSPEVPAPNFSDVEATLHRRMAAGLGISYAALARDFTQSNFASNRAEQLEDRKAYRPVQARLWRLHSKGGWERVVRWAITSGAVKLTGAQRLIWRTDPSRIYRVLVVPPGWEWVNPLQEAKANEVALKTGMTTLQDIAAASGKHWKDVARQRLREEQFETSERERLGMGPKAAESPAPVDPKADPKDDDDDDGDDGDESRNEKKRPGKGSTS